MNVAIFTLTRDRLDYTQSCFQKLHEKAGYDFDHYVVDNGSEDGTNEWIQKEYRMFTDVIFNPVNLGIAKAANQALDMIGHSGKSYDLIAKFDNDCEVVTDDIVAKMVEIYQSKKEMLISPRVTGIVNQPKRGSEVRVGNYRIGRTGHVGGLFTWFNADLYLSFLYPDGLPLGSGDDTALSVYALKHNCLVGYAEDLVIHHKDTTHGQALKYPDYFIRKFEEADL